VQKIDAVPAVADPTCPNTNIRFPTVNENLLSGLVKGVVMKSPHRQLQEFGCLLSGNGIPSLSAKEE